MKTLGLTTIASTLNGRFKNDYTLIKKALFVLLVALFYLPLTAQVKREKESRIDKTELPSAVVALLPQIEKNAKHLRYYKEIDGDKISYEVKLKKAKDHFSIEFSQLGTLEDIEVIIPKTELPEAVLKTLKNNFEHVHLKRIQKQFRNENNNPKQLIEAVFESQLAPTAYEILISGKTNTSYKQFELLIDSNGTIVAKRPVIFKDYEHLVY